MTRKYLKELDINLVSVNDVEHQKTNQGCLFAVLFFIGLLIAVLAISHFSDPCRKDLQACYCKSLTLEPNPAKRQVLLKEIKDRGYSCGSVYPQKY